MWIHGPFPPGDWNDLTIFRDGLKHLLQNGERVEADDGYKAEYMFDVCHKGTGTLRLNVSKLNSKICVSQVLR